jgi:hypothetical protein
MIDKRTTIGVFRDCMKLIPRMVKEVNRDESNSAE